ncbi:MAG TPA: preprotein translocase subunit SecG [Blastocatellia bacterium]|nr:preprotein translocase subunit SecG [Blastocatellia bacterium]
MLSYILMGLYIISCLVLILFVLLQPGKSDAAAVFGGGANSTAFGPRGTQTVLAKITIGAAIMFFLIAFLYSVPGLFEQRSLGEGVEVEQTAPAAPAAPQETQPPATEQTPQTTNPAPANQQPATEKQGGANPAGEKKPEEPKKNQ